MVRSELIKVLEVFEQAYIERNPNKINSFMNMLFDKNEDVIILGTSNGEWCLSYDEVKDLFLSDWNYWGDLRIKIKDALVEEFENTALIYVPATIKYTFSSNSDTYKRYLGFVKGYFNEEFDDSKKPNKVKLSEINWTLCHLLNQRDGEERSYLWDLRISFVLINKNSKWIIKQMQFALPTVGYLPDVRIDNMDYSEKDYEVEIKKLKEYSLRNTSIYKTEVNSFLKKFNDDYLNENMGVDLLVSKYFTFNNPFVVNIDEKLCKSQEEIKALIKQHRDYYDELKIEYESSLISCNESVFWVITNGIMKKTISEEKCIEDTINIINHIFSTNMDDKEKLFNIRRRIAIALKESSKGEDYIWPFRFEAMVIKEEDQLKFKYIQFSLPFNYILEGKTEAASVLEGKI